MRIHIQNAPDDPLFAITLGQWEAAAGRAGEIGTGHDLSIGETAGELVAAIGAAEAVIAPPGAIAAAFPAAAPRLSLIFSTSAGVDGLAPFDRLPASAVLVCNRGIHGEKAGEYAIMAILLLAMQVPALLAAGRQGCWAPRYTPTLCGRRLCVVGLGTLGGAAAARAAGFGMHVTGVRRGVDPHPRHPACRVVIPSDELDAALPEAEFLLLTCPLTPLTRRLIDRRRLLLLPKGAGVVNIGRGAVLEEEALCDLLDGGQLGGAVLDVFGREPLPPEHRLWRTRNLIVTPHISADDPTTYNPRTLDRFFAALAALGRGETPANAVDPVRGY